MIKRINVLYERIAMFYPVLFPSCDLVPTTKSAGILSSMWQLDHGDFYSLIEPRAQMMCTTEYNSTADKNEQSKIANGKNTVIGFRLVARLKASGDLLLRHCGQQRVAGTC
ncbi:uncharacterized protein LOC126850073 isoform X1 [Cataglyphis hispanica]|uniref:uncharacterized protein LOC126850073 isoform X1 n=1 Tax=Cataglyphis hispanica TaxID=1086592 RepID=UPI0021803864|nr:uncharacterized protein LOC126850073 isoform X1 [Cataglyphis hispanica]